jgi:hypothetical protein
VAEKPGGLWVCGKAERTLASSLFRGHSLKNNAGPATAKTFSRCVPQISVVYQCVCYVISKQDVIYVAQ